MSKDKNYNILIIINSQILVYYFLLLEEHRKKFGFTRHYSTRPNRSKLKEEKAHLGAE